MCVWGKKDARNDLFIMNQRVAFTKTFLEHQTYLAYKQMMHS